MTAGGSAALPVLGVPVAALATADSEAVPDPEADGAAALAGAED